MPTPPFTPTGDSGRKAAGSLASSQVEDQNVDKPPVADGEHHEDNGGMFNFGAVLEAMREEIEKDEAELRKKVDYGKELIVENAFVIESNDDKLRNKMVAEKSEKETLKRKIRWLTDELSTAKGNLDNVGPAFATKTAHAKELEETIARMLKSKLTDDKKFQAEAEEAERLLVYWSRKSKILAIENARLEKDLAVAAEENEAEVAEHERILDELDKMKSQHSANKEELTGKIRMLEEDLERVTSDATNARTRATEEIATLAGENADIKTRNKLLEDQVAALHESQAELLNTRTERDHALAETEKARQLFQELGAEKEAALSEVERLKKILTKAEATTLELRGEVAGFDKISTSMKIEKDQFSVKCKSLGVLNNELEEERNRALEDLKAMTSCYKTSQDNVSAANASVDRLELRVHGMQDDVANLIKEKNNVQNELNKTVGENADLNLKLGTAFDELEALRADVKRADCREQEGIRKNLVITQQRDELLKQVELLKVELGRESATANSTKAQAVKQIEELSGQKEHLLSQNKALGDQLTVLQSTIQNLASDKQSTQEQFKLLAEKNVADKRQAVGLQARLETASAERDCLLEDLRKLKLHVHELSNERSESASSLQAMVDELSSLKADMESAAAREQELKRKNTVMEKDMQKMAKEAEQLVDIRTAQLREDAARSLAELKSAKLEVERYMFASEEAKAISEKQKEDLADEVKNVEMKLHHLSKEKDDIQARATKQIEELGKLLRSKKGVHFDTECRACGAPLHALFRTPERKRHKGTVWDRLHKNGTYSSNAHKLSGVLFTESPSCDHSISSQPIASTVTPLTPSSVAVARTTPRKSRQATPRDLETTFKYDENRRNMQLRTLTINGTGTNE